MNDIKKKLVDAYGGFADKRIKKLESGDTFIIDKLGPGDIGADGKLLGGRCRIFCRVIDVGLVEITLTGSVPLTDSVRAAIIAAKGKIVESGLSERVIIEVRTQDLSQLKAIAREIGQVTNQPYKQSWFKFACPNTASALERFCELFA